MIRRRIAAVTCATIFLALMTMIVVVGRVDLAVLALPATSIADYLYAVRLCSRPLNPPTRQALSATALVSLLLGPLVVMLVEETRDIVWHVENASLYDRYVQGKLHAMKTTVGDWQFLRNIIVVGFRRFSADSWRKMHRRQSRRNSHSAHVSTLSSHDVSLRRLSRSSRRSTSRWRTSTTPCRRCDTERPSAVPCSALVRFGLR